MDRSMIGPWKAEEKDMNEKLYTKLQGLTLLYSPTDEFRSCFHVDMFLKPNKQAFFQVMHYLFRLLDPVEFRKRFYWPINDKRDETNFRSSTVEYLKHLNEKHQLQWSHITSYVVVMPGGMKFITFLLDFVGFVVQELTRQREKQISTEMVEGGMEIAEKNLKRMRHQNEFFKEYISAYMSQLDELSLKLCEKTQLLDMQLENISKKTGLTLERLTDDCWLAEFEAENRKMFEQRFTQRTYNISSLEQPLLVLKEVIDKFHAKESEVKYDRDAVRQSLRCIQAMFPTELNMNEESEFVSPVTVGVVDDIKMKILVDAFNSIHSTVAAALVEANQKPCAGEFVSTELSTLKRELEEMGTKIADFQKMLYANLNKPPQLNINGTPLRDVSHLMMKFVSTPPIKLKMLESSRNANLRLPLMDDFSSDKAMESFNNFLALPPRSARKHKNVAADKSFDNLSNTMNSSRIMDPMKLLRTIQKKTSKDKPTPQQNLTVLGGKWKERQCLFGKDIDALPTTNAVTPKKQSPRANSALLVPSPYTPLNTNNDRTRIARSQLLDTSGSYLMYSKKCSVVKKVKDASMNLHNLSTSPSGYLEPLFSVDMKMDEPAKLDTSLNMNAVDEENPENNRSGGESETTSINRIKSALLVQSPSSPFNTNNDRNARSQLLDTSGGHLMYSKKLSALKKVQDASLKIHNLSTSPSGYLGPLFAVDMMSVPTKLDLSLNNSITEENAENNLNAANRNPKFPPIDIRISSDVDEDALFNISDSVLKDVTM